MKKTELAQILDKLDNIEHWLKGDKEVKDDRGIIGDIKDIKKALFGDTRNGNIGLLAEVRELNSYRSKLNKALLGTWVFILGIIGKWLYSFLEQ